MLYSGASHKSPNRAIILPSGRSWGQKVHQQLQQRGQCNTTDTCLSQGIDDQELGCLTNWLSIASLPFVMNQELTSFI